MITTISTEETIRQLQRFLQRLRRGEFADELEQAFGELNLFVKTYEAGRLYLLHPYLPELYAEGRIGQQQLNFLAARTLDYDVPHLAQVVTEGLIQLYALHENEELLVLLFDIIVKYSWDKFASIESSQNLRIEANGTSFLLKISSIRSDIRLPLLQLLLKKYVQLLVRSRLPKPQELPSIIQRLNAVVTLLSDFSTSELARHTALIPFTLDYISYTKDRASRLFGIALNALDYDERLFTDYQIPLFPVVEPDKLSFVPHKITFTNEGLGSLPPAVLYIQVGDEKFELGELPHFVPPDGVSDLFLDNTSTFFSFLKDQKPNLDIKIVFSFKKFRRSYDFGVLAKSVGHWLEEFSLPDRELALPHELPVGSLPEKEFERLCEWIVAEDPEKRFKDVRRLNEDGGGERGRDVLATEVSTGGKYVFQCKRVKGFGPSDIEKELKTFAEYVVKDPTIKPDVYVLFLSSALTDQTEAKGNDLAQKIGMKIEYWSKGTIERLVRTNPIVKERFWKLVPE